MARDPARPDLRRGDAMGCWTVLRDSTKRGCRRYYCRATCCGQERPITIINLLKRPPRCTHCTTTRHRWPTRVEVPR